MPRFFFHVHDGESIVDREGTELSDERAARSHAVALAGRIVESEAERIALGEDWSMEVTDAQGLILFRLDFHVTEAPAVRGNGSR